MLTPKSIKKIEKMVEQTGGSFCDFDREHPVPGPRYGSLEGIAQREIKEKVGDRFFIYLPENNSSNIDFGRKWIAKTPGRIAGMMATRYGRLFAGYDQGSLVDIAMRTGNANHIKKMKGIGCGEAYWIARETLRRNFKVKLNKEKKVYRHGLTKIDDKCAVARAAAMYVPKALSTIPKRRY